MAQIIGIDHVQLAMPQGAEDAARRFYGDVLGLREIPKPDELTKRGGCWFVAGAVQIHLGVEAGFIPAKKAHPALVVDDLHQFSKQLLNAGCEIVTDVQIPGWKRLFTFDPFGNRIELMERMPDLPPHD